MTPSCFIMKLPREWRELSVWILYWTNVNIENVELTYIYVNNRYLDSLMSRRMDLSHSSRYICTDFSCLCGIQICIQTCLQYLNISIICLSKSFMHLNVFLVKQCCACTSGNSDLTSVLIIVFTIQNSRKRLFCLDILAPIW